MKVIQRLETKLHSHLAVVIRQLVIHPVRKPGLHAGQNTVKVVPVDRIRNRFYLRFFTLDEPGILAKIAGVLGEHGISIASMVQLEAHEADHYIPIVLLTHEATEAAMNQALEKIGRFPFRACGRARTMGIMDGSAKVMGERPTGKVVGVHIIGPKASDLIAEATLAINLGATVEDIAESIHAHPTLSETVMEAALNADSRAIHILNK